MSISSELPQPTVINDIDSQSVFREYFIIDDVDESEESIAFDQMFEQLEENQQQANLEPSEVLLDALLTDSFVTISQFTQKVTAETFSAGASLTSGFFSALGSIAGSCGVFCTHGLGAIAQAGSGLSGVGSGFSGINMPGFSVDQSGNFALTGDINSLSKSTGLSTQELLSGKYSTSDIIQLLYSAVGAGFTSMFGFGFIDLFLDGLIPSPKS